MILSYVSAANERRLKHHVSPLRLIEEVSRVARKDTRSYTYVNRHEGTTQGVPVSYTN